MGQVLRKLGAGGDIQGSAEEWPARGDAPGLVRQRLTRRLLDPTGYAVGRVVAPAGSGKSRLLAHVALAYQGPVAWCGTPEPVPRSDRALAEWLWDGLAPALGAGGSPPSDIGGLVDALAGPGRPILVIADDLHLLEGSDAELALADLIRRLPPRMRMLLGSRVALALDLSRLRVSGQLVEIGPDDLRFRAWEVEELFRDVYGDPLVPEDVATLARCTDGWAAYLQLFHLATARKPNAERRRVLVSLANRSRLVKEYLTQHVLAGLSPELQDFLIRTSVLRRPTVALCDELLGWTGGGSREMLAELERRQLFTDRLDDDGYRYHSVLLSYLEARLVEAIGPGPAREEHRRAALLLEREGLNDDATAAFAKAEDWDGVARTFGHPGRSAAALGGAWLEALPPTVVETDSLLLMARSRRALASGALADAVAAARAAESVAASSSVAESCRQERDRVAAWLSPDPPVGGDWLAVLRRATQRQPTEAQRAASGLGGPGGRFAEGAAAFLAGDMQASSRLLRAVITDLDAAPPLIAGAHLIVSIAGWMCGRSADDSELDRLRDEVEEAGIPWLDRMARVALVMSDPQSADTLNNLSDACRREGDRWGEALVALLGGIVQLSKGEVAVPDLDRAARIFEDLGAGVLQTLAHGYLALAAAVAGDLDLAAKSAHQARTLALLLDVPGAAGLAALALGRVLHDEREAARGQDLLERMGTWEWHRMAGTASPGRQGHASAGPHPVKQIPPSGTEAAQGNGSTVSPLTGVRLRCLGGFSLVIEGRTIDESVAKPMERALLHLLAMHAGEQVHRETLIEALWPEADRDAGLHRLQVAISALRRLLAADQENQPQRLVREGDSYRLALQEDSDVDVWHVEAHLRRAATARRTGQHAAEEESLAAALSAYGGPLLPGDGPADWVVGRREALVAAAVDAAARLGSLRLDNGEHQAAAEAARVGLALDRYRDELWKLLIEAADRSGHHAEAGQARRSYAAMIDELGV